MIAPPDYIVGYFERFEGLVAVGWVADRRQPDRRLTVELWLGDEAVAVGIAGIYRGDVEAAGMGDGRYGFRLMVPDHLAPAEATKASVRLANTAFVLPGSPQLLEPGQQHVTVMRGEVNQQAGLAVRGWAYDERHPDRQLTVELLDGDEVVASGIADRFRRDLLDNGIGDGRHAFEIKLPMRFADGRHHVLSCRVAETGDMLARDGVEVLEMTSGVRSALRRAADPHLIAAQPKAAADLLQAVAAYFEANEQRLPRSVPFAEFPVWRRLFHDQSPPEVTDGPQFLIGILDGEGGEATQASIAAQLYRRYSVVSLADRRPAEMLAAVGGRRDRALLLLESGETLQPSALAHLAKALADPDVAIAYTDHVRAGEPVAKAAWSYDFFLAKPDFGPAAAYRGDCLPQSTADDDWDDVPFRAIEGCARLAIRHIPVFAADRTARNRRLSVMDAHAAAGRHVVRCRLPVTLQPASDPVLLRPRWAVRDLPAVSLVIPTRDGLDLLRPCLESIRRLTVYPRLEILIVDNGSSDPATHAYFRSLAADPGIRVIDHPGPFNFSAINNHAVAEARGEIIGFVNNDILLPDEMPSDWLEEIAGWVMRGDVGAVGIKLAYGNDMVQHGGVVLGLNGAADHAFRHCDRREPGHDDRLICPHQVSAVTAALMFMRKAVFERVNGFEETLFPVAFNDVDLCIRLGVNGWRILMLPQLWAYHLESASRGTDVAPARRGQAFRELENLRRIWRDRLYADPFYNPNLGRDGEAYVSLAW